jgi:hypothetical protein
MAERDSTSEDILALNDGRILRGSIIESSQKNSVGLWTAGQKLEVVSRSDIKKSLHLEKRVTDSTINVLYVNPPPELLDADYHFLTLFGGFSTAAGSFSAPSADGSDPGGSGYAFGLHVSLRVFPTLRWATSLVYGKTSMDLPEVARNWTATGSPDPYELTWILTGVEFRTEGTSLVKAFAFAQGGELISRAKAFTFKLPLTFFHPPGTGSQEGSSSKNFAICVGAGFSVGRFSLSGRLLKSSASYAHGMTIQLQGYQPTTWQYKYDQPINVVLFSVGFSPI